MAKDNRELTQKLKDRNTKPTAHGRQRDAKHEGPAKGGDNK